MTDRTTAREPPRRRQARPRLRLGADQYRRIVETTREGVWLVDPQGCTSFANARMAEMLGYRSPTELQGLPLVDFLDEEAGQQAERMLRRGLAESPDQVEVRLRRRDGAAVWALISPSPFFDADGRYSGALAMVTDITERKQAEAALEASQRRIRRLIESNIIGITIGDLEGRILDANEALLRLVGYSHDDLRLGRLRWDQLTPPEYLPFDEQAIAEARQSGSATPWEKEYIRKDGTRIPVLIGFAMLDEAAGTTVAFILDLSERKQAENRQRVLAEALRRFTAAHLQLPALLEEIARYVAEQLGDGCVVYLLSEDGQRLEPASLYDPDPQACAAARAVFAAAPGLIGEVMRTGQALLWPQLSQAQRDALGQPDQAPERPRLDVRSFLAAPLRLKGATAGALGIWRHGSGQPYTAQDQDLLADLADRAALAIDNARLYHSVEATVRVRDEVLGAVSHDLKNPVTAIKAEAQLQARRVERRGLRQSADLLEGLRRIDQAAGRMSGWIDELLDVARLQTGQDLALDQAPTDLVELTRQAVADRQQTTRQHALSLRTSVPRLVGDYDAPRLRRVLDNLLDNAVKYSPAGGEIEVQLARVEDTSGAWAVLRVVDRGIGIPEADRPHIFERFHRGRNVTGRIAGTGIGLAGAHRIVEQHGGRMEVASQEGVGSTFSVWLPLGQPEPEPPPGPTGGPPRGR